MTMGEGGAVYTNNALLKRIIESFRDWGRDCWCPSGRDNTCGQRFDKQYGRLPYGYDHKYVYSHFGYNLKANRYASCHWMCSNRENKRYRYFQKGKLGSFQEMG